ncbi:MAG: hypothetical protein M3238_03565, partial [Actinomycetota bacterium]|nr:hypothetical protein [Actinomycetota bacterium]
MLVVRRALAAVAVALVVVPLLGRDESARATEEIPPVLVEHVGPDLLNGTVPLDLAPQHRVAARPVPTKIGARHRWLGLDVREGASLKTYQLRGKARHVEIWVAVGGDEVATGLRFPEGDCRN